MDSDDNTVSPNTGHPSVPNAPSPPPSIDPASPFGLENSSIQSGTTTQNSTPQAPSQTTANAPSNQAQTTDSSQSFFPQNPSPKIVNRPSAPQLAQKYPAFQKSKTVPPSFGVQPQQPPTTQDDAQAHYNTQQDAHVVQPATTTQPANSFKPKRSKKKLVATLIIVLFLLGTIGTSVFAWSVAYNKLTLGDNNTKAELAIKQVVYSLPFTKKPPEYLIAKTISAHQEVTRESFDVSLAIGSDELSDPLGISQLDFQVKGNVDYTDPKNVFFNTEIFLTKGLNLELRKKEKAVYFIIKDIPSFLLAFAGMSKSQFEPVLNKWVFWDTTPLDTEARRTITDQETNYLSSEFSDELFVEYVDDYLLENLTVTDTEVDGHKVYKVALDADKEMIDYIQRKLEDTSNDSGKFSVLGYTADSPKMSDFVKTLVAEIYIDKSSYYTRKVILSLNIEFDSDEFSGLGLGMSGNTGNSSATIAFAAKFDKFGEEVVVEVPEVQMDSEEFMEKITVIVSEIYGNLVYGSPEGLGQAQASARDARRKADLEHIRAALELYRADCKQYPNTLDNLLSAACGGSPSSYVFEVPKDSNGSEYYYQSGITRYDLCATLESTLDDVTTCPDPSYNYHITNP